MSLSGTTVWQTDSNVKNSRITDAVGWKYTKSTCSFKSKITSCQSTFEFLCYLICTIIRMLFTWCSLKLSSRVGSSALENDKENKRNEDFFFFSFWHEICMIIRVDPCIYVMVYVPVWYATNSALLKFHDISGQSTCLVWENVLHLKKKRFYIRLIKLFFTLLTWPPSNIQCQIQKISNGWVVAFLMI